MSRSLKRRLVVGLAALVALAVVGATAFVRFWSDFGEDPFAVGASLSEDGDVVLFIGQCGGGRLEHIDVAVDATDGFEPIDQRLWAVDAAWAGGPSLEAGEVIEVQVGAAPPGMTEAAPLVDGLPDAQKLQVDIDTSVQSFGPFFRLDDLTAGQVWAGGHGLLSPDRFQSLVDDNCD